MALVTLAIRLNGKVNFLAWEVSRACAYRPPRTPLDLEREVDLHDAIFLGDPDQRDEFLRSRAEVMLRSRSEAGCITYAFTPDPLDPGRVLLFERWESKAALADHLTALREGPRRPDGEGFDTSRPLVARATAGG